MENTFEDRTSLHFRVMVNNSDDMKRILSKEDQDINLESESLAQTLSTPLQLAIRTRRFEMAWILLRHNASIDLITPWEKDTLLNYCVSKSFNVGKEERLEFISLLLSNGADREHKNFAGMTPLNTAAKFSDLAEVTEMLIDKGSNINTIDNLELTPLMHSVLIGSGVQFDVLMSHGADINMKDMDGRTVKDMITEEHLYIYNDVSVKMKKKIETLSMTIELTMGLKNAILKCIPLAMYKKRKESPLYDITEESMDQIAKVVCEDYKIALARIQDKREDDQ
jgi:ankyrin repeat protein